MSGGLGSGYIQHTFRWGVGNKFRSKSINRLKPTHIERLTVASVPADYFVNDRKNVQYNEVNEHWEVFWCQNGKLNGKPFPIRKYGVFDAKKLAYEFANTVLYNPLHNSTDKLVDDPDFDTNNPYYFDRMLQCWVVSYYKGNRPSTYAFSVNIHGYTRAKELAIQIANKNCNKVG
ncbi:transcription factor with AP2 domain(s), putative (ApiAP2) [Babesia microti strain RI]|uniref:Transcription factor with AP2 domain(S), putative (ApiAP2) n=1 Tax=Babesia microti (strain RI) TaxID=1133968 RepID=I7JD64_BABMR|nr:transcription factor with AP2 domain(s), putative (ApiAP2) [Babesia microti strain RI]CCF75645.1 transcription factor with AP2 domain(s), putative (ApiAP2) [Babesia microti strain RI]|eukprot:XP_012650053.1 transcription factor with AP2 domain(s), putative (ApiAP2) [Babesia microti strain RI]